jgi:PIN domain nuclease of toxin-antitoxin system
MLKTTLFCWTNQRTTSASIRRACWRRRSPPGFNGSLAEWLRQAGYRVMPLTWDDCERANTLPMHHTDPMDRMLIATALDREMTVVSDDEIFGRYGVSTVW